jgi:hypothetical protein
MDARVAAFWKAHDDALAQEGQGAMANPFKIGQKAWKYYLASLSPGSRRIYEHLYLQSLANYSGDDRIVQFMAQIGVRKRSKD